MDLSLLTDRPKAVSVLIMNALGEVLAVSRKGDHADLGLPGGKLDVGESFAEAAVRETLEETGVSILSMSDVFEQPCRVHYAHTFQVHAYEGVPRMVENDAWVGWVAPQKLLEPRCSFHAYNRALFEKLGLL